MHSLWAKLRGFITRLLTWFKGASKPKKAGAIATAVLGTGLVVSSSLAVAGQFGYPLPPPTLTPPNTIPDDCSVNVTTPLNNWFSTSVPNGSFVQFPANGCYLINPTVTSGSIPPVEQGLLLYDLTNVTLDGNGATLQQTVFPTQQNPPFIAPVLDLYTTQHVEVENLNVLGPAPAYPNNPFGNGLNEGDEGWLIQGTLDTLMTHDTINSMYGDNFQVLANNDLASPLAPRGTENEGVTITHSTFTNPGYDGSTVEGVIGYNFSYNTMTYGANTFSGECDSLTTWNPTGPGFPPAGYPVWPGGFYPSTCAEYDMTWSHNSFNTMPGTGQLAKHQIIFWSSGGCYQPWPAPLGTTKTMTGPGSGNCIPVLMGNWNISANTFTNASPSCDCIGGQADLAGDQAQGLTITGNFVTGGVNGSQWNGGGNDCLFPPPSRSPWVPFRVMAWTNVTIQNNSMLFQNGATGDHNCNPGHTVAPGIALNFVTNAALKSNSFSGAFEPWYDAVPGLFPVANDFNVGVTSCNNSYGWNQPATTGGPPTVPAPSNDGACPPS